MATNKVIFAGTTLIDLSGDTIESSMLAPGYTAHDRSGAAIVGTSGQFPLVPHIFDMNYGYVNNGTWMYEDPTRTYTDVYEVESGKTYLIALGTNVGSRFRAMFTTEDVTTYTSNVAGTMLINKNNPAVYDNVVKKVPDDGYILVAKDNVGKTGVKSYVYDVTKAWL